MPDQQNITNIPSNRVEFIDSRTGLVSREWYRFFLNLFNLAGAGGNQISLDEMQIGPPPQPDSGGGGGGTGTVTSVDVSGGTTGLTTTGGPVTSSGTITLEGTLNVTNGGTGATTAGSARSALGAAASGGNSDITSLTGITGAISSPDYVQFDTAYATTLGVGQLGWDGNNTLGLGMYGGNVVQKIGEDFFYYVKASAAITKGQLCMFTGSVGASGVVTAAPSTGVTSGQYIMGVAAESIAHNGFGLIQVFGTLRNVDTSAFADGDVLYYDSAVTGGFTTTFPSSGPIVTCAAVVNGGSAGGGVLQVRVSVTQRINAGSGVSVTQTSSGATVTNTSPSSGGTVTSVGTAGSVSGLTLTGGPITSSGTITLGGSLDLSSPPAIGGTTPAAGTFTTLTATGQTSLGGAAGSEVFRAVPFSGNTGWWTATGNGVGNAILRSAGASANSLIDNGSANAINFRTNAASAGVVQLSVSHTASAVNYVQVTGAATTATPVISAQGSDSQIDLALTAKGTNGWISLNTNSIRQVAIVPAASAVNYWTLTGSATTKSPVVGVLGTDTNISQVFQSKGTGAIDLAAGSSGVNISNGGTVTAITRTATGSGYTSIPAVVISAPTTAGGVQATATITTMLAANPTTVQSGGTGYTLNDILTFSGGTPTGGAGTYRVTAVSAGVVTAVTAENYANYSALATNPVSTTGGTGTGCTLNVTYAVQANSFNITNAGSGYVEQPTVSFSGGGGSGAAAYATVGSDTFIRSLGQNIAFTTPNGRTGFRVVDLTGGASTGYWNALGGTGSPQLRATGGSSGVILTESAVPIQFSTASVEQLRVAHTASAVNYVQVTGAATGSSPTLSTQGSDANVGLNINTKGTNGIGFNTGGGTQMDIINVASSAAFIRVAGAASGNSPSISSAGSATNIDLALTPKGTGVVRTSGTGIRLYGSSSGYVGLTGAAAAGSTTYTLPAADGTSGQALSTNGSGTLSWATPASSNITAQGLWENNATISSNYSITSGNNALSSGPVTIATGVTVTVPSGSVWTIV